MSSTDQRQAAGPERGDRAAVARASGRRAVSLRAVLLGLLCGPPTVFFLVKCTWVNGGFEVVPPMFPNAVAILFFMAAFNHWLRRKAPRYAFSAGEMLTVYLMTGVSTGLTSRVWDLGGALASFITYPFWLATETNHWKELLWPNLPSYLTVWDRDVLEGFYVGHANPYTWSVIRAWAIPAFWWATLVGALMWVALCLNSIVRRRWEDEEKLPFPMAILPVALADDSKSGLLQSKLFWTGLAISSGICAWNTLSGVLPNIPGIPMEYSFFPLTLNHPPWDQIKWPVVSWDPLALGLCYLMPLDLALSLFVFDIFWTSEYVLTRQLGWSVSAFGGFPYGLEQVAGGFMAIFATFCWLDRRYLLEVAKSALGLTSALAEDRDEAFGYRSAVLGAVIGLGYLWWILSRGGMQAWVVALFLIGYFMVCLVISRLRAQLGPPSHHLQGAMPSVVLPALVGTRALGAHSLGMLYLLFPFLYGQRNNPVPLQLEALRMAQGRRMERRRIAIALAVTAPLAIVYFFWASIHIGYHSGLGAGANIAQVYTARGGTEALDNDIRYPAGPDTSATTAICVGFVITLTLMFMKLRFPWFLHPVAFPIAISESIQGYTVAIFAVWLLKTMLLRYGGLRAHRTALPLFLGFIVGYSSYMLVEGVVRLFFAT